MMKRMIFMLALTLAALGAKAQNCDNIMLPYFGNNQQRMETYRQEAPEKFAYRCAFARAALYASDTVPASARTMELAEVVNVATGAKLADTYKGDVDNLSYYAYNFSELQGRVEAGITICFPTPRAKHPYLVLRTRDEMYRMANLEVER